MDQYGVQSVLPGSKAGGVPGAGEKSTETRGYAKCDFPRVRARDTRGRRPSLWWLVPGGITTRRRGVAAHPFAKRNHNITAIIFHPDTAYPANRTWQIPLKRDQSRGRRSLRPPPPLQRRYCCLLYYHRYVLFCVY